METDDFKILTADDEPAGLDELYGILQAESVRPGLENEAPVPAYSVPPAIFRHGYRIVAARSGETALKIAASEKPDFILDLFENCETTFRLVGCRGQKSDTVLAISRQPTADLLNFRFNGYELAISSRTCSKTEGCRTALLLNLVMPDMSGFDILSALKKSEFTRSIPVMIIVIVDDAEIEDASKKLLPPVSNILDLKGYDIGKFGFTPRAFSLRKTTAHVVYSVAPMAAGKEQILIAEENRKANGNG